MDEQYEGVDTGINDDSFEQTPVQTQYQTPESQDKWQKELEAAQRERQAFNKAGVMAIERFADKRDDKNKGSAKYNLYTANTEIKQAAIYAKTPVPDISRKFKDPDDDVSRVAAIIMERNISYELDADNFDSTFKAMIFDRLVPGMGVGWVRLEQEESEPTEQLQLDPITGEQVMVQVPGQITNQFAKIDYVAWDDFLWSPCRVWSQCRWVARRIPMSKDDINARFSKTVDPSVIASLSFEKMGDEDGVKTGSKLKPKNTIEETTDVFEIWDKESRLIYWISLSATVPLDVQQDTNEFEGFFPTPSEPMGRWTTTSTLPISDYSSVQDLYLQLDDVQQRLTSLTNALKLRWVYDPSNKALKDLYSSAGDLEGIPVEDWATYVSEKGGLKSAIEFAPLAEVATTYQTLLGIRDQIKNQIFEIEGISDIMRGAGSPYESAYQTQQKSSFGSSRLGIVQHQVAKYAQELLRLKAHLIGKFYLPEIIMQRAGTLNQADRQFIGPALQLLKEENMRHFRLTVSVDSIQMPNWNAEKQEKSQLITSIGQMIGQMMPMVQQYPELGSLGLELIKFSVSGFKGAETVEGAIDSSMQKLLQAQSQAAAQPQKAPEPSPEQVKAQMLQMKIQSDQAIAQSRDQTQAQIAAMNAQLQARELALKERESQLNAWEAQIKAQHEAQKIQLSAVAQARTMTPPIIGSQPGGY